MPEATSPRRGRCYALLLVLVLPNLVWILLDRSMWLSDTSLYGYWCLRLNHALADGAAFWVAEALSIVPKPPIVPWLGQFFVPVGSWLGHVESGILLVNFVAQVMALLLLFEALFEYTRSEVASLTGCACLAAAPLFHAASVHLYAQPLQMAVVCWFIHIMALSRRRDGRVTLLQLVAASSFAMLTMLSSPLFCALPGAVALWNVFRRWGARGAGVWRLGLHAALALALLGPAVAWYVRNLQEAMRYANHSLGYVWGALGDWSYAGRLGTWWDLFLEGLGPGAIVAGVLVAGALGSLLVSSSARRRSSFLPLVVAALQIAGALAVFAKAEHQTYRYPLPLMAYVGLMAGVGLKVLHWRWLRLTALAVLVAQLGLVAAAGLGLRESDRITSYRGDPPRSQELIEAIAGLAPPGSGTRVVVGTGELGVYNWQVELHAARTPDAFVPELPQYMTAEFVLTGSGEDAVGAWEQIQEWRPDFVVLVSEAHREVHENLEFGWGLIIKRTRQLTERVASSPDFERVPLPGYPELVVFRRVP